MNRWLCCACLFIASCGPCHRIPDIRYPASTQNDSALWGGTGFVVSVDPAFFEEVPAGSLVHSVHGITAIASDYWGDGTFGAWPRAEPLHFSYRRFRYAYGGLVKWRDLDDPLDWGKSRRVPKHTSERLEELLVEFKPIMVKAIDGGQWNNTLRRRLTHANVRALAILHVNLSDLTTAENKVRPGADGTIHLCITLAWEPETEPVQPPPRVFIPTSRSTATLFELDPEHVPALLDCYRRILEVVEGPHKPFFEERD